MPRDLIADRLAGWWAAVLEGQMEQGHPVYGSEIRAAFDGDVLVVRGRLAHRRDLQELRQELKMLRSRDPDAPRVRLEVSLAPKREVRPGLLDQTIVGVFESRVRADAAARLLASHAQTKPARVEVVSAGAAAGKALMAEIPDGYRRTLGSALSRGCTFVVATVDEVRAFRTRLVLDEETRSLMTLTLPPRLASQRPRSRRA